MPSGSFVWARGGSDMAGNRFKYFMVFDREALDEPNAFTLAEFGSEILG